MAMFAEPEWVLIKKHPGYNSKMLCEPQIVSGKEEQAEEYTDTDSELQKTYDKEYTEAELQESFANQDEATDATTIEDANDSQIKHEKHAIVSLMNNDERTLNHYCFALKSISNNGVMKDNTPILVFHEEDLLDEAKDYILTCVNNPISFHLADFSFPPGFDPIKHKDDCTILRMIT
mmetsp:Transcript_63064/g.74576  ORF Transcript_63064/g.74576 Transcript_63064/m.74576 type:complete len:177 (+) Transcript_63064:166-696(+)